MKKPTVFNEAKPRTPRGEARQREIKVMEAMGDLLDLDAEEKLRKDLAEKYGIVPGHPKYSQILAIWREQRFGKP